MNDLSTLTMGQQLEYRSMEHLVENMTKDQLKETIMFLTYQNFNQLNASRNLMKTRLFRGDMP